MSPLNPQGIQLTGRYVSCAHCQCPWTEPIPPRWPLTIRGVMDDAAITPHLPTCTELGRIREGGAAR